MKTPCRIKASFFSRKQPGSNLDASRTNLNIATIYRRAGNQGNGRLSVATEKCGTKS